jgi:hypothetical protein
LARAFAVIEQVCSCPTQIAHRFLGWGGYMDRILRLIKT